MIKGKEDPYNIVSLLSWLSDFGYSKVVIQSYDPYLFNRFDSSENTKAGRHIDDFLETGPEQKVEHLLGQARA